MQFGLMFFASSEEALIGDKYHLVVESAKFADQHGFSSLWVPERHFTKFGCLYPNPAVLHAALARETKHLRLQAGSVVVPIHNPIRIAEEWAVVDNLSGGRVGISFAPGWNPDDFAFFPERYQDRHKEMFSGIEIVQKLWQGESIQATNGIGNQIDLRIYPTPIQKELPVWLTAAGSPQTFIKAGEIGVNLLTHLLDQTIEQLAEKIALYRQARAEHGHAPETGVVTVMLHTFVGEDMNVVRELVRAPYCQYLKSNIGLLKNLGSSRGHSINIAAMSPKDLDDFVNFLFERFASSRGLIGTPETCVNLLEQLDSIGVDEAACLLDFGPSADLILKHLPYLNQLKERYNNVDQKRSPLHRSLTVAETLTAELSFSGTSTNNGANSSLELPEQIQARCQEEIPGSEFYHKLRQYSVQLEASFQGIEHIWRRDGEALGLVQLLEELKPSADAYKIHPAFLDACFQVLVAALPTYSLSNNGGTLYIPAGLRSLQLHGRIDQTLWSHAVLRSEVSNSADPLLEGDVRLLDRLGNVVVTVSGLRLQRTTHGVKRSNQDNLVETHTTSLQDWLYELQWQLKLQEEKESLPLEQPGSWLIFTDKSGIGQKLAVLLKARGETCFIVTPGEAYKLSPEGQFCLNPSAPEQMHQLIQIILGEARSPCRGVVHLWSLDTTPLEETTIATLEKDQVLSVASALHLIQALAQTATTKLPIWFVTKGTQPASKESTTLAVAQAPLWGLGRVVSVEYPNLPTVLVDLDRSSSLEQAAGQLFNTIQHSDGENQIAFRKEQRYVARLNYARKMRLPARQWDLVPDATYLITGGLGGLGLLVARWMVERGAKHLVLLGRSAASETANQTLSEFKKLGVEVKTVLLDVSSQEQVAKVIADIERSQLPLRGVVHLAGVLDDSLLVQQDWQRFIKVRTAKVEGAWNLHTLTQNSPLDFFVLFSSAACLVTMPGQGNYAAANAFLDALAHHRRAHGQPALSINWGPWADIGHAATPYGRKAHEGLARLGIERIAPQQGLEMLQLLLQQDLSQVGVVSVNWSQLLLMPVAELSPVLCELKSAAQPETKRLEVPKSDILQKLKQHSASDGLSVLIAYIQSEVAKVLRLEASKLPNPQQGFFDMGMDSLMGVELKNRLEASFGVSLPVTLTFEFPTIKDVAGYLARKVMGWELPAASDTELPKGEDEQALALSQVEEISDDGIEASIAEELAKLENLVRGN